MKTSLTLSTVLFALTLTPAAFANGAQDQSQVNADSMIQATATPCTDVNIARTGPQLPDMAAITRTVMQSLEIDVRANVLESLRSGVVEALQIAAPALVEATTTRSQALDLTAR